MGIWHRHIHGSKKHFDGMRAFYVNALLRSLAFAMVGIFTPIFVYQKMLPIVGSGARAIAMVGLFYIGIRLTTLICDLPGAKLIERLGFRRSVVLSVIILIGYFGVMALADKQPEYLLLASPLLGLSVPFYWISRGSVIAIDSKKSGLGKQVGFLSVLERIAGVLGPVASGLMIAAWGFEAMYLSAMMLLVASVFPLFSMPHHIHRNGVSLRGFFLWLKDRRFLHQGVSSVARALDDYSTGSLWPLVVFLIGINYEVLGVVFSALTVLSVVVRYLGGLLFDKLYLKGGLEDEVMYTISLIGTVIGWIGRMFVSSIWGVLWVDGGTGPFGTTYRNVSDDYAMLGGKRMHEIAYFTYKQMSYSVGVILFGLLVVVGAYFGIYRELVFGVTSLWIVISIVQARESNLK